jgi:hypothetical protein
MWFIAGAWDHTGRRAAPLVRQAAGVADEASPTGVEPKKRRVEKGDAPSNKNVWQLLVGISL